MTGSQRVRAMVVNADPGLISEYRQILCGREAGDGQSPDEAKSLFGGAAHLLFGAEIEHPDFPDVEFAGFRAGEDAVAAAVRAVKEGQPYLVAFIDLEHKSSINGLETAERIRAADAHTQIVLVAGYDSLHPLDLSGRVPPADRLSFVKKPVHPFEMQQLVISALHRRRAQRSQSAWPVAAPRDNSPSTLQASLNRIPVGAMVFDPHGQLVAANAAMHRLCTNGTTFLTPGLSYGALRQELCDERVHQWGAATGTQISTPAGPRWAMVVESVASSGEIICLVCDITAIKTADAAHWRSQATIHLNENFARICDRIDRSISNATGSKEIRPILSRLRLVARQRRLTAQVIDLSHYMGRAARRIRRGLPEGVRLEIVVDAGLWPVAADPDGFDCALAELTANACDAMSGGGRLIVEAVNVRVTAGSDGSALGLTAGDFVRMTVQDTGHGMAPEIVDQTLIPFRSSSDAPYRGLGLAIVHAFAIGSGGAVEIKGGAGSGASVRLYLPKAITHVMAKGTNRHAAVEDPDLIYDPAHGDTPDSDNPGHVA